MCPPLFHNLRAHNSIRKSASKSLESSIIPPLNYRESAITPGRFLDEAARNYFSEWTGGRRPPSNFENRFILAEVAPSTRGDPHGELDWVGEPV